LTPTRTTVSVCAHVWSARRINEEGGLTEAREFYRDVEDLAAPIATDFSTDSRTLMVTFGGMAGGVGIPPFEFFKITSEFGVKRLFVRDLEQAMYHRSLPGMGHGPDGVVQYVKQKAAEQNIERLVVMGNSGGGYASLLFGALLDANSTYAFSPVTFIGPVARLMRGDHRAPRLFLRAAVSCDAKRQYFDLRSVFAKHGLGTEFHIYYCGTGPWGRLDELHANRMAAFPNVNLRAYDEGGHKLVKLLRDRGELKDILSDALA
jgi:hypothetical protein